MEPEVKLGWSSLSKAAMTSWQTSRAVQSLNNLNLNQTPRKTAATHTVHTQNRERWTGLRTGWSFLFTRRRIERKKIQTGLGKWECLCLEKTHRSTARTCNTEKLPLRFEPGTFLLWYNSTKYQVIMLPQDKSLTFLYLFLILLILLQVCIHHQPNIQLCGSAQQRSGESNNSKLNALKFKKMNTKVNNKYNTPTYITHNYQS